MNQELMEIIKDGLSIGGSTVGSIVGVMLTSMFASKNTEKSELAKIKAGKFGNVLNELYDSGKITLRQYQCNPVQHPKESNFSKRRNFAF